MLSSKLLFEMRLLYKRWILLDSLIIGYFNYSCTLIKIMEKLALNVDITFYCTQGPGITTQHFSVSSP